MEDSEWKCQKCVNPYFRLDLQYILGFRLEKNTHLKCCYNINLFRDVKFSFQLILLIVELEL